MRQEDVLGQVFTRALRNCPWSAGIYAARMVTLERIGKGSDEVPT